MIRGGLTRPNARRAIVDAANRVRVAAGRNETPYRMRHLQRAVFVVRQAGAVGPEVLTAAGFRAERAS